MRNIFSPGRRPHGASTITQQVARYFLLSNISSEISLARKIKEAILALRMEFAYTKEHILELYLNEIFFGRQAYGIAAAALHYFDKSVSDLTPVEAAMLAALPKAPSYYTNPKNIDVSKRRRNWVLGRMKQEGYISLEEKLYSQQAPIALRQSTQKTVKTTYFAEEVRRLLIKTFGENALYKQGLVVRTTMDHTLQLLAHQMLSKGLVEYDRRHGWRGPITHVNIDLENWHTSLQGVAGIEGWELAIVLSIEADKAQIGLRNGSRGYISLNELQWARRYISPTQMGPKVQHPKDVLRVGDVILTAPLEGKAYKLYQIPLVSGGIIAIDPHTGDVLAMSGGFSFDISQFNRATQAMRQPGSAFKPFVFLKALEHGLTPVTKILDAPLAIQLGPSLGVYRPHNYNKLFYGPTTLRLALEKSRNVPTVRLIHEFLGIESIVEISQRLGIYDNMPPFFSMALGAGETTLQRMVGGFASFVNGGRQVISNFIAHVQDRYGKTIHVNHTMSVALKHHQPWSNQSPPNLKDERPFVIDPAHAYQITSMLEGSVKRGTAIGLRVLNRPIAAKTGTSNDFRDAWCVGYTPDLAVGIYVGYDAPLTLGDKEQAARVTVPIFINFMKEALKDTPITPFRVPPGVVHVYINYETGRRASPHAPGTILEAFKAGTESTLFQEDVDRQQKQKKFLNSVY